MPLSEMGRPMTFEPPATPDAGDATAGVSSYPGSDRGPAPGQWRAGFRPRNWLALGVVIGLVIGLGVGVLIARNGSAPAAEQAAPPVPPVTTVTVTAPPPASTAPASATDGADVGGMADGPARPDEQQGDEQGMQITDQIGPIGDMARRIEGDPLAVGRIDAPVAMVVYSDYRCPYCALFSQQMEQPLVDEYVASGLLRLEWRDFPIFGDESRRAAVAGRAAAKQGKFWEFNSALYAAAPASGHPELPVDELIGFARQAGVADIDAFRADLDDPDLAAAVQADYAEGSRLGVPATPSFVINGYPMRGAQPVAEFEKIIDAVLALRQAG